MSETNKTTDDIYQIVADSMSDLVCIHEPSGIYIWVSPSSKRMLGYSSDEMIGMNPYDLFHPDDQDRIRSGTHEPALDGHGNIYVRYRMRHADGHYIWMESLTQPIVDEAGEVVQLHTTSRDVTEQKQLEKALAQSETLYRSVVQSLAEGVIVFAADGTILTFNDQAAAVLGMDPNDLAGRSPQENTWKAIRPDGSEMSLMELPVMVTLSTGQPCRNVRMGVLHAHAEQPVWISINSEPVIRDHPEDSPGKARAVVTLSDISHQLRQEAILKQWSLVFKHSQEPIALIDHQGDIQSVNEAFIRLVYRGIKPSEPINWKDFLAHTETGELALDTVVQTTLENGTWRGELWLRDIDGGLHVTWASISAIPADPNSWRNFVVIFSRYQEKHEQEEALRIQATHDPLTQLPNRMLLMDRFDMALKSAHRYNETVGCLYLDLDDFKPINDRYGHAVGDKVLTIVAERLQTVIREDDTVARLGGDEFVILATALRSDQAVMRIAEKVLAVLAEPIEIRGQSEVIHASLGLSLYPNHADHPAALLEAADTAMYTAKRQGGDRWLTFLPEY